MKLAILALAISAHLFGQSYDVVLANGRVIDPESNLDAVRNVGIRGGRIGAVSASPLDGRTVLDVKGLVVTAGFIDLHSHGQDSENYGLKVHDGVTTGLEMEVGVNPLSEWYAAREGRSLINFGATSGHIPARMTVMHDTSRGLLPRDAAANRAATAEERKQTYELVRQGLDEGGLGIGPRIYSESEPRRDLGVV
jgi:N-acyl-D-aspartate/D-glutamate deacylase